VFCDDLLYPIYEENAKSIISIRISSQHFVCSYKFEKNLSTGDNLRNPPTAGVNILTNPISPAHNGLVEKIVDIQTKAGII